MMLKLRLGSREFNNNVMRVMFPLILIVVLSAVISASAAAPPDNLGSGCDGPNRCIRASECRRSFNKQKREREPVLFNCGFEGLNLLVCCPPEQPKQGPNEDSRGHTLVPTGPVRSPVAVSGQGNTQSLYSQPSYVESRPTQNPTQSTRTTHAPHVAIKTTQSVINNNNRQTPRPNSRNTEKTTEIPTYIDKTSARPLITQSTQRTQHNSYTSTTTYRNVIDSRVTTPKYNQYPSNNLRTSTTTFKPHLYQETDAPIYKPTGPGHYITPQASLNTNKNQYTETNQGMREVFEENVKPAYQLHLNNNSTDTYNLNSENRRPSEGYEEEESHSETYNPDFARPKRPASPQAIVFQEDRYTSARPNSRPTSRPTTQAPSYHHESTLSPMLPPRRPFEPPSEGPDRPSIGQSSYGQNQPSRPSSRPPNSSSTYPGANTVGSGEGGQIWPSSTHNNNRPSRPSTTRPVANSQDLTQHPNFRLFSREICGTTAEGADRIINGHNATLGQYPWMALLGYKTSDAAEDFVSVCGGTLISWKYVLTAAHCLKNSVHDWKYISSSPKDSTEIRVVRLGEHVISTQPDCDQDNLCADPIMDIEIEQKIPHPSYGKPYLKNDIGLIRLRHAQPRLFSSYVRPICLPLVKDKEKHGRRLIVAGWGTTRRGSKISSDVLQMAVLPEVGLVECNDAQEDDILKPVIASQMCAAVTDHSASSCYGDSGGPLMDIQQGTGKQENEPVIVQLGIVSVGSDDCGLQGAPSIYTRVSYFTKWILDTMRD